MTGSTARSIRVGLFFLFGVTLIWIVYETFSESNLYSEAGYLVEAPFEDLKQLKSGSDVRLAGVSIGAVMETRLENGQAIAELSIEGEFKIPADSTAIITTAGLLGNNYVAIQAGDSKKYLQPGQRIKTKETADINAVIAQIGEIGDKVADFMDSISGDSEGELFASVNRFFDDIKPEVREVLDNMSEVSGRLRRSEGTLGKLISEDEVYDDAKSTLEEIRLAATDARGMFNDAQDVVNDVKEGSGPVDFLLNDEAAAQQLRDSVANINEFSNRLNDRDSTLGRLISDDQLYLRAEGIINKVEGAVESVENSGPITAVGITANALF